MGEQTSSEFVEELRDMVRGFATRGETDDAWPALVELGLAGIGTEEDAGGSGGDLADLVVLVGELAAAGISSPIVEASVGAWALGRPAGDRIAAVGEESGETIVVADGTASGTVLVRWPELTDTLLLTVGDHPGTVEMNSPGVTLSEWPGLGAPIGRVTLLDAPMTPVDGAPSSDAVQDRLAILHAAAAVGAARGALTRTIEYVRSRHQFGAPLAAIPAVVSTIGVMSAQLDLADAALSGALRAGAPRGAVAAARLSAAEMATVVARGAHQLHGAMGIAQEYPLHRVTIPLWDSRDAGIRDAQTARRLGSAAREGGESLIWTDLTA